MTGHITNFLVVVLVVLAALFLDSYIGLTKIFAGPAAS
jgi:hypothetical protein